MIFIFDGLNEFIENLLIMITIIFKTFLFHSIRFHIPAVLQCLPLVFNVYFETFSNDAFFISNKISRKF